MKIQKLNLAAFGPFTEKTLFFDEAGLHVVYGPNEAGKSSALRGLKALLYGIEERTLDNFFHPNEKLRISGCLQTSDGHELTFVRRKGRKNTLLTPEGATLEEQALAPFLQGVTPELFETLFGIDHHALVQGGQEILEQKGEVGQALFSAALGSHALHAVLAGLDDEADALFRPRGSTQAINSALKSYADLNRQLREQSLSARSWDEQRRALQHTTEALGKTQSDLAAKRIDVNRLQRIQRALPRVARRRELLQELTSLGDVVVLSDDFGERRRRAVNDWETGRAIVGKLIPRLDGLQKQLEELSINRALLDQAEQIDDLHARLGSHRKAQQDRPYLEVEAQQLLADARSILKDVRPDLELTEIGSLHSILARRHVITELGNKQTVLLSRIEQANSNLLEIKTRLKAARRARDEIPESGSPDALRREIAAARKLGDVDAALDSAKRELSSLQEECDIDLSRLTLWDGELKDLVVLGLPSRETIARFENAYEEMSRRIQRLEEKKEELTGSLKEAALRLDEIQRGGVVPSETDLSDVRSERDAIWQLLRRRWLGGEDISAEAGRYQGETRLPDAFEERLTDADKLSDRLRREADRVHTMASLRARHESMLRQTEEISGQLEECAADKVLLDREWRDLWHSCRIAPTTPREMRVWLDDVERLRELAERLSSARRKSSELQQLRERHIRLLNQQLLELERESSAAEGLEAVLLECEVLAERLAETTRRRDALDKEVKDRKIDAESLREEHRVATEELEAWKSQWGELMRSFGLQFDSSPTEIDDFIEKVRTLFAKQGEAEKLQIRIDAINEEAESFRSQVENMVTRISPELGGLAADDAVVRLNSLLSENRSRESKHHQIEAQIEQTKLEIEESNALVQAMNERLDSLCLEAHCGERRELDTAEKSSVRYLHTRAAIDSVEQELLETGEGASVKELERVVEGVDPDVLPGKIKALINQIEDELEPRRIELAEAKGRQEKELEIMDGSDHAAALAEQAQAVLAGIRSNSERYVQAKLAARILRRQIERYREENQGPLIKRASEHFSSLTLGSFGGLLTDFNERDEPVLAGIRPNGKRVGVEGMSSGTRDQLYLALRLASLEKYMESAEPMPFIVDDVLVDFDDKRSQAGLNALANLAGRTQVILFTHHSRVIEQARRLQGAVQIHELSATV